MAMPRQLTESELAAIEERASLCFTFGDPTALRAVDVADLIQEVRDLWALRRTLMARTRAMLTEVSEDDGEGDPP